MPIDMNPKQPNDGHHPELLPQVKIQSLTQAPLWAADSVGHSLPAPEHPVPSDFMTLPAPLNAYHPADFTGPEKRRNRFADYWRKIGGGSLTVSLLIHAGILGAAYFIVQTIVTDPKVDFLPGGGGKKGDASAQLSQQVQQKKRSALNKNVPMRKVVSNSLNAAISLPDVPMDTIDMPEMSSTMGGMSGSGGFGSAGGGGGFGKGQGLGGMSGFVGKTAFGKLGGDGLPGAFYDLKQNPERQPIEYNVNNYAAIIANAAAKKFAPATMKDFYKASQQVSFTFLAVPYMAAEEGPKAFNVEKEVQPRGWFVHYTGIIYPPTSGEWRFVGNFDDALVVYINNKPVLDGSWLNIGNYGEKQPDEEIRQNFGGPPVLTGTQHCWAGKWVKLDGPAKIDIIVGERPGGRVGGLLLVQHKKTKYKERADGSPVLPVFTMSKPDMADLARMKQFAETSPAFELETENIPVFEVRKSMLEGASALDKMMRR